MTATAAMAVALAAEARHVDCTVAVTCRVIVVSAVVMSSLYRFRREDLVQVLSVVVAGPLLHDLEHVVVYLAVRIAKCWVMEHTHTVVQDLVDRHIWVVPSVYDARRDVLQDSDRDLTGWWVQDVGEVILGQHAVCWVGGCRVRPDLKLVLGR